MLIHQGCNNFQEVEQSGNITGAKVTPAYRGAVCAQVFTVSLFKFLRYGSTLRVTDDSIIPLQVKGNGKVKKAWLWVYVRGGVGPPLTVYDFSRDRSKKRLLDFLDGYRGYVHVDAYSGYDEFFGREGIIEVGCWVHARRKFDEAVSSRPQEASEILARIEGLEKYVERLVSLMSYFYHL